MRMLFAILFWTFAGQAFAQPDYSSGNYMLPHCKALGQGKSCGPMCGLCAGIIETSAYLGPALKEGERFCPPHNSTNGQYRSVVMLYLEKNPQSLHLNFKDLAVSAMREVWPCK